jgi:hypothetical protein
MSNFKVRLQRAPIDRLSEVQKDIPKIPSRYGAAICKENRIGPRSGLRVSRASTAGMRHRASMNGFVATADRIRHGAGPDINGVGGSAGSLPLHRQAQRAARQGQPA